MRAYAPEKTRDDAIAAQLAQLGYEPARPG
jgi:hypothetical protein